MRLILPALLALASPGAPAFAQTPVVVELFTSQSCSSCPPAEAAFRDLAKRTDLVALEWHVDYWDQFKDRVGGVYKDPYSAKAHTARQLLYDRRITGSDQVYTPQLIVGGVATPSATKSGDVRSAIDSRAKKPLPVKITSSKAEKITFTLENLPADAELMFVTFLKDTATDVKAGENHGRKLASSNVVTSFKQLKPVPAFAASAPPAGSGCALLVHAKAQGEIIGAAYCPG
jgi:hypothetical protein